MIPFKEANSALEVMNPPAVYKFACDFLKRSHGFKCYTRKARSAGKAQQVSFDTFLRTCLNESGVSKLVEEGDQVNLEVMGQNKWLVISAFKQDVAGLITA